MDRISRKATGNKMNFIAVNLDSGYDGQEEGWFKYKE